MKTNHCDRCGFHERETDDASGYVQRYAVLLLGDRKTISTRLAPFGHFDLCQECWDDVREGLKKLVAPRTKKARA